MPLESCSELRVRERFYQCESRTGRLSSRSEFLSVRIADRTVSKYRQPSSQTDSRPPGRSERRIQGRYLAAHRVVLTSTRQEKEMMTVRVRRLQNSPRCGEVGKTPSSARRTCSEHQGTPSGEIVRKQSTVAAVTGGCEHEHLPPRRC